MDFERQVLLALYRATSQNRHCGNDTVLPASGRKLFGKGWAGDARKHRGSGHSYYPRISMALGKLQKRGMVRQRQTKRVGADPQYMWRSWQLTLPGYLQAEQLHRQYHIA